MIGVTFPKTLSSIRSKAKMTQAGLAALTGFSVTTISRYECGEQSPSMDALDRLATALGCTPAVLLTPPEAGPSGAGGEG